MVSSGLDVAGGQTLFLQILLVVVLGFVERHGGNDLGGDGLGKAMRLFESFFGGAGGGFLLRCGEENGGTVLGAEVRALAVDLGGIVILPEDFEQLLIGELGGIRSTSTASAWPVRSVQTSL